MVRGVEGASLWWGLAVAQAAIAAEVVGWGGCESWSYGNMYVLSIILMLIEISSVDSWFGGDKGVDGFRAGIERWGGVGRVGRAAGVVISNMFG